MEKTIRTAWALMGVVSIIAVATGAWWHVTSAVICAGMFIITKEREEE